MAKVTTEDVNECIKHYGLYGLTVSELRQVIREDGSRDDAAAQIRCAAARHVLVAKMSTALGETTARVQMGITGSAISEYTRLHIVLADMIASGRLSHAVLKDDYHGLIECIDRINRARKIAGLGEISIDED
jgi:hypothetical protein